MRLDLVGTALSALGPRASSCSASSRPARGASCSRRRRAGVVRPLAGDLAVLGGGGRARRRSCSGSSTADRSRRASRSSTRRCSRSPTLRGGLTAFFFQYLAADGAVLHGAAVPVGRARAVGDRHRRPPAPALGHAARSPRSASRRCSRTRRRVASCGSGSCMLFAGHRRPRRRCSTRVRAPRSSRGRCCSRVSASARWRRSSARSPCRPSPTSRRGEVGGLQNTFTNLGASIGTALAGAVLIADAHVVVLHRHRRATPTSPTLGRRPGQASSWRAASRSCPTRTSRQALDDADVPPETAEAIVEENEEARLDGLRAALAVLAVIALVAMFTSRRIPDQQPAGAPAETSA